MKKATGNKLRLGIFVTVATVLFIAGIYFVGERQQLFSSTFQVSGIFRDISGLQVGNNVRFSGINVGIIDDIEQMTDSTVRVDMLIVEHARKFMKINAIAIIGSDGLMGNKIVVILPGTTGKEALSNNAFIETSQQVTVDAILASLKVTADNAAHVTGDLSYLMESIRQGRGTIGRLLMDSMMAENVDQALVNIKQGAGGFKQNMDAAGHNFLLRGYLKKKENQKNDKIKEDQKTKDKDKDKTKDIVKK